jgi:hypothetical protein
VLPLENVEVRAYDVDYDNNPEIVVSASQRLTLPASGPGGGRTQTFYVTYVARWENGSEWHPLLSFVTDEYHLDEFPRLQLIDAVDANGDGVAELLFRAVSAPSSAASAADSDDRNDFEWQLYRVTRDNLVKVFDSTAVQQ